MVVAGQIPGVDADAWREVAKLKDLNGKPNTALSAIIVDSSGMDQMSITQTLTFFSEDVSFIITIDELNNLQDFFYTVSALNIDW